MSDIVSRVVFVTGGTGFVGQHVLRALTAAGWRLRALVRPARVAAFTSAFPDVEVTEGDLDDERALTGGCRGADSVVHVAALMADADWASRSQYHHVNVEGTKRLLIAAAAAHVGNFIHLSSVGVLGTPVRLPADEQHPYGHDLSFYESSKQEAERIVLEWLRAGRIRGTVLRPAQLYGPGMRYGWPETVRGIRGGVAPVVGGGKALLHLTHVDDVVQAVVLALENRDKVHGEVFNVAGPQAIPIGTVFDTIADALGVSRPRRVPFFVVYMAALLLELVPYRLKPGRLKLLNRHRLKFFRNDHVYDTSKARVMLGFRPRIAVADGLRRWILEGAM